MLYAHHSVAADVLAPVPKGTLVSVNFSKQKGRWVPAELRGLKGWMLRKLFDDKPRKAKIKIVRTSSPVLKIEKSKPVYVKNLTLKVRPLGEPPKKVTKQQSKQQLLIKTIKEEKKVYMSSITCSDSKLLLEDTKYQAFQSALGEAKRKKMRSIFFEYDQLQLQEFKSASAKKLAPMKHVLLAAATISEYKAVAYNLVNSIHQEAEVRYKF